jgi:hypothetical protein
MAEQAQKARCVNCRSEVVVPASYTHGDHIKCGACGTQHKVQRGDVLRLVLADVTPLKDALHNNRQIVSRLQDELQTARGSFGIGANGLGIAVAYVVFQIGVRERPLVLELLLEALAVAVISGLLLELANFLFLAKRQRMARLAEELGEAQEDGRRLQQKIREAGRI